MKIYLTYCSAQKNNALKNTSVEVTPDILYTSKYRIQPFMQTCRQKAVKWAIFSDLYGVWFSEERHAWYEKSPDSVTESEFKALLANFDGRLAAYDEICFYRPSPIYFHSLYRRLLQETKLKDQIRIISSIQKIE